MCAAALLPLPVTVKPVSWIQCVLDPWALMRAMHLLCASIMQFT